MQDVVLEVRPWPQESSKTRHHALAALGLGFEGPSLGLVLGLESPSLDYKQVKVTFFNVWVQSVKSFS
jgi:hypothetical protein